ncbi:MAG: DNA polymerase III subunit alpha [Holosporales bacterium]|nr:DNA polymerase III subunit alpha [Holosporales bacterium]
MATPSFVHLRVHSAYSLSHGAIKVSHIPDLCLANSMPAVAITDINNLFGVMDIAKTLSSKGIQHIVGSQITLNIQDSVSSFSATIVLLAKSLVGYKNLIKLSTASYQHKNLQSEGPAITMDHLEQYHDDLICLTGGDTGPLAHFLLQKNHAAAEALLSKLLLLFKDNLYIEIMRHGLPPQITLEPQFLDLAAKHGVPIVATNDVYFEDRTMFEAHDVLLCIANAHYLSETNREQSIPDKYFKSQEEMQALFADLPEALENTVNIAKRCHFILQERAPILPKFTSESGLSEPEELRLQSAKGLQHRLETRVFPDILRSRAKNGQTADLTEEERAAIVDKYTARLENELGVIEKMGFPGYFLIVSDFIKYAKSQNIPVGPGRGSGAGSIVAWALTITDIDPIKFSLIFERFLNPERVSMPDFDVDFCQTRRAEVIDYVRRRYGDDKIAQIITFGKLQARAVLRDVGRVLAIPYGQVDKVCRLVPNNPSAPVTLSEAVKKDETFEAMMKEDPAIEKLINIGLKLEGLYRHASVHAAGVVIGDQVLADVVPLYYDGESPIAITQINMKYIENAGLLKFDFLGLKTLSVIQMCVDLLKKQNIDVDISLIPLDDPKTFELLCNTNVLGVFQLESGGMREVVKKLRPDRFEDLIALVALYRPGPMNDIPKYLARKHGREEVAYPHSSIQSILESTYGVMVYQEQVMQIAQVMGGDTLGGADLLRRAMGKKIKAEMDAQRKNFVDGAIKNGVAEETASDVFSLMAKFASYGFNKSHSAPYALISYQTAFLKANFPVEFFAATASFAKGDTDGLIALFQDLRENGLELLPPDINKSFVDFVPEGKGVRYALSAIKNVGEKAMEGLVQERAKNGVFSSLEDFAARLGDIINKRQLENLIASGALDAFGHTRKQLFNSADLIVKYANMYKQEKAKAARSLFGDEAAAANEPLRLRISGDAGEGGEPGGKNNTEPEWNLLEKTQKEFEALGFFLKDHPLDVYSDVTSMMNLHDSSSFARLAQISENGVTVRFAAIILSKEERTSQKNGGKYAFVTLSDKFGIFEVPFFSESYARIRDIVEPGRAVYVEALARQNGDSFRLTGQAMERLEDNAKTADENKIQRLSLQIQPDCGIAEKLSGVLSRLENGTKVGGSSEEVVNPSEVNVYNGSLVELIVPYEHVILKISFQKLYEIPTSVKAEILSWNGVHYV